MTAEEIKQRLSGTTNLSRDIKDFSKPLGTAPYRLPSVNIPPVGGPEPDYFTGKPQPSQWRDVSKDTHLSYDLLKEVPTDVETVNYGAHQPSSLPPMGASSISPSNPGKKIKTLRTDVASQVKSYTGGLSGKKVNVDHIQPLWAGGVNEDYNKQLLSVGEHWRKTGVDEVARTLYEASKSDPVNFRALLKKAGLPERDFSIHDAINWNVNFRDFDTKDLEKIFPADAKTGSMGIRDENGDPVKMFNIPEDQRLPFAIKMYKKWSQQPNIGNLTEDAPSLKELGGAAKKVGSYLWNQTLGRIPFLSSDKSRAESSDFKYTVAQSMDKHVGQGAFDMAARGALNTATLGILPNTVRQDLTGAEEAANIGGAVLGGYVAGEAIGLMATPVIFKMLSPIAKMMGMEAAMVPAGAQLTGVQKMMKTPIIGKATADAGKLAQAGWQAKGTAQAVKAFTEGATTTEGVKALQEGTSTLLRGISPKSKFLGYLTTAGNLAAQGQLQAKDPQTTREVGSQLLHELGLAGAMQMIPGGFKPGNLAMMFTAEAILSGLEDKAAGGGIGAKDMVINGAIMSILHGTGAIPHGDRTSDLLGAASSARKRAIGRDAYIPPTLTSENLHGEIVKMSQETNEAIRRLEMDGTLNQTEKDRLIRQQVMAGQAIYFSALPEKARTIAMTEAGQELAQRIGGANSSLYSQESPEYASVVKTSSDSPFEVLPEAPSEVSFGSKGFMETPHSTVTASDVDLAQATKGELKYFLVLKPTVVNGKPVKAYEVMAYHPEDPDSVYHFGNAPEKVVSVLSPEDVAVVPIRMRKLEKDSSGAIMTQFDIVPGALEWGKANSSTYLANTEGNRREVIERIFAGKKVPVKATEEKVTDRAAEEIVSGEKTSKVVTEVGQAENKRITEDQRGKLQLTNGKHPKDYYRRELKKVGATDEQIAGILKAAKTADEEGVSLGISGTKGSESGFLYADDVMRGITDFNLSTKSKTVSGGDPAEPEKPSLIAKATRGLLSLYQTPAERLQAQEALTNKRVDTALPPSAQKVTQQVRQSAQPVTEEPVMSKKVQRFVTSAEKGKRPRKSDALSLSDQERILAFKALLEKSQEPDLPTEVKRSVDKGLRLLRKAMGPDVANEAMPKEPPLTQIEHEFVEPAVDFDGGISPELEQKIASSPDKSAPEVIKETAPENMVDSIIDDIVAEQGGPARPVAEEVVREVPVSPEVVPETLAESPEVLQEESSAVAKTPAEGITKEYEAMSKITKRAMEGDLTEVELKALSPAKQAEVLRFMEDILKQAETGKDITICVP